VTGAPLPSGTVTFLFSDIEGSTDLLRRVGDHVFGEIRGDHRRLLREAFSAHGGREIDTAGDGFFIAFESAHSAAGAALRVQLELASFIWPEEAEVRVRIGLHTAEPHLTDEGYVGVGVHRAARICDAAHGGQILLSNATAGIIEDAEMPGVELIDLGEHRLKGLPQEQRLFQLRVPGLPSQFGRLRTADARNRTPGAGTFVYTDLADWQQLVEEFGDEANERLLDDYYRVVSGVVESNRGVVLERIGDYTLAVFDDASDAARAAAAILEAIQQPAWPAGRGLSAAIALHSGRWSGDPERPVASTALSRLARLANAGEPGQVLVSQTTAALLEGDRSVPLRSLGKRTIAGLEEPVQLYELVV
jgi:class 3 adenylate cyclase